MNLTSFGGGTYILTRGPRMSQRRC